MKSLNAFNGPDPLIRVRSLLVALCGAVACSASASSRPEEILAQAIPVVDTLPRRAAEVDLSGPWATGSVNEPAVKRIVLQGQCNYSPALWILEQHGDTVLAWWLPESRAQGIATPQPARPVPAVGRISGVDVAIGLGQARYLFRYDSVSGHLRGTYNGAPFWAIRQTIVRPEACIPVP